MEKSKERTLFVCGECSHEALQWNGQCPACDAWNSLSEVRISRDSKLERHGGGSKKKVRPISEISRPDSVRTDTGIDELNRVLGGGLVRGSVILLGGDPGIGKSTLALQCGAGVADRIKVLYVTGEESLQQLALRSERLIVEHSLLDTLAENHLENILNLIQGSDYQFLVIDSVQSLYSTSVSSSPGTITQVRECAERLVRYAKTYECTVLIVGHVTKEGNLAGPKVLEHMVDTVLYFEGDTSSRFRLVRAFKNRFGGVNEMGVFAMTERGLREVINPSAMFLSGPHRDSSGSVVLISQEGTRPLLLEVQALVDESALSNPRRLVVGFDSHRLGMLLAVLHRHGGISLSDRDVFVNIAGGIRISESAADVAVCTALLSSYLDQGLPADTACFGEIGLAGEIRPVQRAEDRLREAAKLGFKRALIPEANRIARTIKGLEVVSLSKVQDLRRWLSG